MQWISLSKNEAGIWEGSVDLRHFSKTGVYTVEFYTSDVTTSDPIAEASAEVAELPNDEI